MPWTPSDATKHTKEANTTEAQKTWAKVANAALKKHGDEAKAIRIANAAIKS